VRNQSPRVLFFGTPGFAIPSLAALYNSSFRPIAVITQPDKPQGRSLKLQASPVKLWAIEHALSVLQPENCNEDPFLQEIATLQPDYLITVAYGGFIGRKLRQIVQKECLNLHPSLLPAYRGATPVPFTLWAGETVTGNTIFRLSGKMDAGPIFSQQTTLIEASECATTLLARLATLGASQLIDTLSMIENGTAQATPQDNSKANYTRKLTREDCLIEWQQPAHSIRNQVKALAMEPGAYTVWKGKKLKLFEVEELNEESSLPAGTIENILTGIGLEVATGSGKILIKTLQVEGKRMMSAHDFQLGARCNRGDSFDITSR